MTTKITNLIKSTWISGLCLFSLGLTACGNTPPATEETSNGCPPANNLKFICGPVGSEDIIAIPDSPFVIVSGLGLGQPGNIYRINTQDQSYEPMTVKLGKNTQPGSPTSCTEPPVSELASYGGLNLTEKKDGSFSIYAVNNHRRGIEIFDLDLDSNSLNWQGCENMPENTRANAVAVNADGTMYVTSFNNPNDKNAWNTMAKGEASGGVYSKQINSNTDFTLIPELNAISGPNGIELSEDGKDLYVSAWSSRQLLIANLASSKVTTIDLDFLPDNIRRQPDGKLIIGGQRTSVESIRSCSRQCPQPWVVVRIDPKSGDIETLLEGPGNSLVEYATAATVVDETVYMTARGDHRVVVAPLE